MATAAKESKQIEKVRKKLEKVLREEHAHFNKETLAEVRENIHKWLNRHEPERLSSETKSFTLFDENRHPSEVKSKFVQNLLNELQNKPAESEKEIHKLQGRVKYKPTENA